jgi:L-alanine-DL-glutamate epimerase-like enolase superfamily enzyme
LKDEVGISVGDAMSKIKKVEAHLLEVPTDKLITDSIHSIDRVEVVTCTVDTSDGISGLGFTYTIGGGGLAVKTIIDSMYAKKLIDQDPSEITKIWHSLWGASHAVGRGGITTHAIAAIDIALWDAKGKTLDAPLYRLLRGSNRGVPMYDTNSGWLHYTERELVESARAVARKGFYGFKIKVGKKTLEEDLERIMAVTDAVRGKIPIMIDANQVWGKTEALKRGRKFQDLGVYWYEEPLVADDIWGHVELASNLDVPIAVGETIFTRAEFANYVRLGACDILQQDVCRVGGITEWMEIATLAEANGLKVSPHFVMEITPSLVASINDGLFVEYIPWLRKLFVNPPKIERGLIFPPESPGIGLDLDAAALRKYLIA